ncbi:MAG: thermonuclease family protein [Pseudomonadota bacterium]
MRINGIDAPEAGQKCATRRGSEWPCGREAVAAMAALVEGKEVACEKHEEDVYGRWIATCVADGVDVGEAMVLSGHAWAFLRFSDAYEPQQAIAESARHLASSNADPVGLSRGTMGPSYCRDPRGSAGGVPDQGKHLGQRPHLPRALVALVQPHAHRHFERRAVVLRRG